jgi:hypothetical protein
MSAKFEYRLIYNDEIDPAFMCHCTAFSPCEPCQEREKECSQWFDLPLYRLSRFNKFIPEQAVLYPEDLENLMDSLYTADDFDENCNDKMEAFSLFEELYYKSDGYIVEIRYD